MIAGTSRNGSPATDVGGSVVSADPRRKRRTLPGPPLKYGNPTRLPNDLFLAVCARDSDAVNEWVEEASDEEIHSIVDALKADPWCALTFRKDLLKALAIQARVVPYHLFQECARDPDLLASLAINPHLSEKEVTLIGERVRALFDNDSWPLDPLAQALESICERGFNVGIEKLQELVKIALGQPSRASGATKYLFPIAVATPGSGRAVALLARVPQLETSHLIEIIQGAIIRPEVVPLLLIHHPNTGREVWLAALRSKQEVLTVVAPPLLAEHEEASTDPEIRSLLMASKEPEILMKLLRNPMDDTEAIADRLMAVSPLSLAHALAAGSDDLKGSIPQRFVVGMLSHPDARVRAQAFRGLG